MKRIRQLVTAACLLFGTGAAAQDSIGADNFRYVDTASATHAAAAEEEEDDDLPLEDRVRKGSVKHATWDNQVPGEWSDGAQARLSIRKVPDETMRGLRDMKALQYHQAEKPPKPNWATRTLGWIVEHIRLFQTILLWLLGILLVAIIVLFIRKNDIPLFRWGRRAAANEPSPEAETGPLNYEALARAAIAAGNFREAVRMRYLQTLQALENRQLIAPGKDKTNMDYLHELAATGWHKPFATLTFHYEYVWYGKLPISNGQFSQLDEQFAAFKKSLS